MKRWSFASILLAASVFCLATHLPAYGCTCAPPNPREAFELLTTKNFHDADVVFIGTAVEVNESRWLGHTYKIKFAVKEKFKGVTSAFVTSNNGSRGGDCSYGEMEKGHDYVVFAKSASISSAIRIRLCSGTTEISSENSSEQNKEWQAELLIILRKLSKESKEHQRSELTVPTSASVASLRSPKRN